MHFDCHRCDTMEFGVYPLIFSLSWFQVPGTKNQILAAVLYIRELLRAEWHRRQSLKVTIHFPKYLISWSFGSHKKNGNFFSWSFELCISVMIQDRWKFWWKNLSILQHICNFLFSYFLYQTSLVFAIVDCDQVKATWVHSINYIHSYTHIKYDIMDFCHVSSHVWEADVGTNWLPVSCFCTKQAQLEGVL